MFLQTGICKDEKKSKLLIVNHAATHTVLYILFKTSTHLKLFVICGFGETPLSV